MKKHNIVKNNYEFNSIIRNGKSKKNKYFIIYYANNVLEKYRFGISVGKKIGNAVIRNRYKRKIRSIVDNNKKYYQKNIDYIIIMRKACIDASFIEMENKYIVLIKDIQKEEN